MSLALNLNANDAYQQGMKEFEDEIAASSAALGLGSARRNSTSPVMAIEDERMLDSAIAISNEENEQRTRAQLSKPLISSRRASRSDRNGTTESTRPRRHRTCTTRRLVIGFLIVLSLFLIGTVVVLSTISYYLAIPDWAYLTERDVPFNPNDAIMEFEKEQPRVGEAVRTLRRREEWEELDVGKEDVDFLEVEHEVLEDAVEGEEEMEVGEQPHGMEDVQEEDNELEWSPQGKGSGAYYMRADWDGTVRNMTNWDRLEAVRTLPGERIPRLIHQTWKSDVLPPKWRSVWRECREGMQDYEYFLWTDELSREFVAKYYPSHLTMFDNYRYPIQRADAIRYFILHRYGGVYMDLDIGCKRRLDPMLQGDWDVILPRTKPVGVSNDLIFSAKKHPFMNQVVHGLAAFDHQYLTNYPTVMFSTGPMFLSAQYGMYKSAHPLTPTHPRPEIRILPKSLYGKNAKIGEEPHAFFSHFYGSSWHADDAGFITFLGAWGKRLMYVGGIVVVLGGIRYMCWGGGSKDGGRPRAGFPWRSGEYQMVPYPTAGDDDVPWHPDPHGGDLYDALESQDRELSPTGGSDSELTDTSSSSLPASSLPANAKRAAIQAMRRAGHLMYTVPAMLLPGGRAGRRGGGVGDHTGLLYFLPAFIVPAAPASAGTTTNTSSGFRPRTGRGRTASSASNLPPSRVRSPRKKSGKSTLSSPRTGSRVGLAKEAAALDEAERMSPSGAGSTMAAFFAPSPSSPVTPVSAPPPYEGRAGPTTNGGSWEEWNDDRR